ncbi:ABC transporter ATP-binding protein [bacterium]|jgi:oligopeptide/dipeptide ABC transporter ATP-binding protein|nr:ABC transporter ATP-binding protein [bacterium]
MGSAIIQVRDLSIRYRGKETTVYAAEDVSFDLDRGKVLALVGESGAGKTTVGLSVLRLLPGDAEIASGQILFEGHDLASMHDKELRTVRGRRIAMIFQDATAGLNPVLSVGSQVAEMLTAHLHIGKREAKRQSLQILYDVGLSDPERVAKAYPFQLSGGMCQRVMIGIATSLNPDVIIADEPTSSLDVTVQAQILHQLERLRDERGTAILLVTHSFGVVAQIADEVAVMYAGRIVEHGDVHAMLKEPLHPYTHALLATLPRLDGANDQLRAIPGTPPSLTEPAEHCPFIPRCPKAMNECRTSPPPPLQSGGRATHPVACYNPVWRV